MFHLILVGILSILILSIKNRGVGEGVGGGIVFVNGQKCDESYLLAVP